MREISAVQARATRATQPMPGWYAAGFAFVLVMLCVHVAGALHSAGIPDSWRDVWWATKIARGEAFPLSGPPIYGLAELGPWWYYLLALPIALFGTVTAAAVFVQLLAGAKYLLAWRLGTRLVDPRFGLALAGSLALAGWSTISLQFPSHTALVETMLLLLAFATWRCWRHFSTGNALIFGLAAGAALTAHPTTVLYVVAAGIALFVRAPSWKTVGRLALAAAVAAAMMAPPLFDHAQRTSVRPIAAYVGKDVAVDAWRRIPTLLASTVVGGAWNGFLLMTPWSEATARVAWLVDCACLLVAAAGLLMLKREREDLRIAAVAAGAAFIVQAAFLVVLRPVMPPWMLSSLLMPLALLLAIGWYGGIASERSATRAIALVAFAVCTALALAPFSLFVRDVRTFRYGEGANPFQNVTDRSEHFAETPVPYFPVRRQDRLAHSLCEPAVLHARLGWVIEQSASTAVRLACGHWPDLTFGGRSGSGPHVAGLLADAAAASGIAPDRVIAGMALYDHVVPIAPASGGRVTQMKRDQIHVEVVPGVPNPFEIEFDAKGADVAVLMNRFTLVMPLTVRFVRVEGAAARLLEDESGLTIYGCGSCDPAAKVHWQFDLTGVADDIDLVVLQAPSSRSAAP